MSEDVPICKEGCYQRIPSHRGRAKSTRFGLRDVSSNALAYFDEIHEWLLSWIRVVADRKLIINAILEVKNPSI